MVNQENNFENQIVRETLDSILKDILYHAQNEVESEEHFYFRGESSYYKLRTPSLYLQKKLTMAGSEYYYRVLLNELGRDDYQENTSLVRLMSELQHYGAKTRMLDITSNPLVALYFAVEKDDTEPGFLFIYKSNSKEEKFDTGHTVAIKSALNFMPQKVINKFLDAVNSIIEEIGESNFTDFEDVKLGELEEKVIEKAIEKIKEETKGELEGKLNKLSEIKDDIYKFMELLNQRARVRERLIYPFKIFSDLQKAHIVIPSKTTDRIRQQQGAFIYPKYVISPPASEDFEKRYETIKSEISDSINALSAPLEIDNAKQLFNALSVLLEIDNAKQLFNTLSDLYEKDNAKQLINALFDLLEVVNVKQLTNDLSNLLEKDNAKQLFDALSDLLEKVNNEQLFDALSALFEKDNAQQLFNDSSALLEKYNAKKLSGTLSALLEKDNAKQLFNTLSDLFEKDNAKQLFNTLSALLKIVKDEQLFNALLALLEKDNTKQLFSDPSALLEIVNAKQPFSVIKIEHYSKKNIRKQLELLGITEGFIYPDIEHQSKALLK